MDSSKFPTQIYPRQYQALIEHLNKVKNYDTNLSSLAFLSASATSIGSSVRINNGKYKDKAILWCVIVGDSGTRKSHVMKEPFQYLSQMDKAEWEDYRMRSKLGDPESSPDKPKTTISKNATMESIFRIHQDNEKGIILFKDEIVGMLKDFNKYNKGGGDKQELMELFNGNSLRVDRATKETIYLPETCINVIGGIQPDKINSLLNEDNISDGFYFRLLFSRVNEHKPLSYPEGEVNQSIQDQSNRIFEELYSFPNTELKIGKDTEQLYRTWFNESQIKYFNNPFGRALQSKLETYVWRFCIILDILDQVSSDKRRTEITPETMENAITLAEYFRTESTSIYEESFREGVLEGEPVEFQRIYRKLETREYSTAELIEKFSSVWQQDNIHKKLAVKELFIRTRKGFYIKTIKDAKK
jgi:hypothetical protein